VSAFGIPASYENNFHAFELKYPDVEDRFAAAMQLADPLSSSPPEDEYLGRNFLLSQWGEDNTTLERAAYGLYNLKSVVEHHVGEPVAVLRKGTTNDILSKAKEDDRLTEDVEIDFGILSSQNLIHGAQGNITQHGPKRMGVKPPFLGFGVMLLVSEQARINADVIGNCVVELTDSKQDRPMPAYIGTVPLEFNRSKYHESKRVLQREILIGNKVCSALVEALKHKTRNAHAYRALSKLALSA